MEESVSNKLKEEVNNCREYFMKVKEMGFQIDLRDIESVAYHFAEWQKEQILKNVVLETKVMEDSDGDGIETPYEKWLTLENTEIPFIPENIGLKDGDKIKVIVFKDE